MENLYNEATWASLFLHVSHKWWSQDLDLDWSDFGASAFVHSQCCLALSPCEGTVQLPRGAGADGKGWDIDREGGHSVVGIPR